MNPERLVKLLSGEECESTRQSPPFRGMNSPRGLTSREEDRRLKDWRPGQSSTAACVQAMGGTGGLTPKAGGGGRGNAADARGAQGERPRPVRPAITVHDYCDRDATLRGLPGLISL